MPEYLTPENAALAQVAENALRAFEGEQRKLAELQQKMDEDTTTVRAKDRSLSVTFDGRGEVVDLKFHGTKYRSMAPAQLASLIVETIKAGRSQQIEKLTSAMGGGGIPGLNLGDIASGRMNPNKLVESMLSPVMDELGDLFGGMFGTGGKPGEPAKKDSGKNSHENSGKNKTTD